jgi:predicted nuclease with TOPRIM domain
MKKLIILVLLAGCASSQHSHPHDHGLSFFKGQINQLSVENRQLAVTIRMNGDANYINQRDIKQLETNSRQLADGYKELRDGIVALNKTMDDLLIQEDKLAARNNLIRKLIKRLHELEAKIEPQKLIEVPDEKPNEEPDENKPQ